MSLSHKLLTIETSIAYEDVQDSWRFDREVWMCEVVEALNDPQRLAALTLKMLSMLTPGCVAYYWKKPSDYKRLNEAALKLASTKSDPTGKALKAIIKDLRAGGTGELCGGLVALPVRNTGSRWLRGVRVRVAGKAEAAQPKNDSGSTAEAGHLFGYSNPS